MDQTLTPDCWRSEAFAEDLCDVAAPVAVAAVGWRTRLLLGALPLLLATAGAVVAAWGVAA